MIALTENKERQKLLSIEILSFIKEYKKSSATPDDVVSLANKIAATLDIWDYNPKEIRILDRKAFMDLMKSFYTNTQDKKAKDLFTKVFSI